MDALNHNSASTANIDRTMTSLVSMMEDLSLKYNELCTENSLMREQLENHLQQQSSRRSPLRKRTPLLPRKRSRIRSDISDGTMNDSAVNEGDVDGDGINGGGVIGGSNEEIGMAAIALNNNYRVAVGDNQQLRQQMEVLTSPARSLMVSPLSTQKLKGVSISYCVKELYNNNKIKNHVLSTGRFTFNSLDTGYVLVKEQGPFNCALEAVFLSCSQLQLQQLRKIKEVNDIDELLKIIDEQTIQFVFELTGSVPPKKGRRKDSSNISSMGKRVVIWKADNEKNKVTKVVVRRYPLFSSLKGWNDMSLYDCCVERGFFIPSMVSMDDTGDGDGNGGGNSSGEGGGNGNGDVDEDGDNMAVGDENFTDEYNDQQNKQSVPKIMYNMFHRK